MNYNNILTENRNAIKYITINRPKQLNALNAETIDELNNAILLAEKDKLVRCIIITGSEDKAFIAGADIKEFTNYSKKECEGIFVTTRFLRYCATIQSIKYRLYNTACTI